MRDLGRWRVGGVIAAASTVLLAGCSQPPAQRVTLREPWRPSSSDASELRVDLAAVPAPPAAVQRRAHGSHELTPVALRTRLEQLLGQHVGLTLRLMRARMRGDPDFAEAAVAALNRNTDDLADAVGAVYGRDGARAFSELWFNHTRSFFRYAKGLAEKNRQARRAARGELDRYRKDFGAFVESATDGDLAARPVAEALEVHIDQLLGAADAYADGDYERAFALQRRAYEHMFPTGKALAGGFRDDLPGEFPVVVDNPRSQLRSALGLLLGEHLELAVDAMRAGVTGAPEFEAAAGALNANTEDLTAAMDGVFGRRRARQFNNLWSDHIDLFVDYTVALAEGDQSGRRRARRGLNRYQKDFGAFVSRATRGQVEAAAVTRHMEVHDRQLIEQIDAYAAEDYERAHTLAYSAYQDIFDAAADLARGISGATRGRLPAGGAQTGAGGTSGGGHG